MGRENTQAWRGNKRFLWLTKEFAADRGSA
jgi:hypothetical protein